MAKLYWEDLSEGAEIDCRDLIFNHEEIVEFATKYDPQPFHIDEQAGAASRFGGIIASSLQTLSACTRILVDAQGDMAILSGLGIEAVQLPNPLRPGDRLSIKAHWAELRRSRSKPDRGMAVLRFTGVNQKGETVIASGFKYMIACRS